MAANPAQQARHQRVRRLVLARFQETHPGTFARYWLEARAEVEGWVPEDVAARAAEVERARRADAARRGWAKRQGVCGVCHGKGCVMCREEVAR